MYFYDVKFKVKMNYVRLAENGTSKYKSFVNQGNVIHLAIGIVIGGAFSQIVQSFVQDIITPVFSLVTSNNLNEVFIVFRRGNSTEDYLTRQQAIDDGGITWNYGHFLQNILNFMIISTSLFIVFTLLERCKKRMNIRQGLASPEPLLCKFCKKPVEQGSTRCPNCTSILGKPHSQGSPIHLLDE